MSKIRLIDKLVKATGVEQRTAVTGTRRAVSSRTGEGDVIRTGNRAGTTMATIFIAGAFKRERAVVGKETMKLDFLTNGRLVFA